MTTSGTYTFNENRNQIILSALRKVGAIASGDTPDAQTIQDASDQLNAMVKYLEASGIHVWTEAEGVLFIQPGQVQYALGTTSTDHAADAGTYAATSMLAAAVQGATSITVNSIAGITNLNQIGIMLDSGVLQWTTVNGTPSGSTVPILAALTDSVSATNPVYAYANNLIRPLRMPFARRYNWASAIDTPMIPLSRSDYMALPNKTNTGIVTQYFYTPLGGANVLGQVYVWPAPPDATNAMKFTYLRPIQDFDTAANMPDLPQEWINCLIWNLAKEMAPEYGTDMGVYQIIEKRAQETLDAMFGWDREDQSTNFGIDFQRMGL